LSAAATYGLLWAGFLVYLGVLAKAPVLGRRLVWGAILLALAIFAAVPPLLSQDVYSYLDYARLGVVHGLNPYVHPPSAAPADPVFAEVGWTEATSAYGPLFTLATYPLAWLPVDAAVWLLKAIAAASVLGLAALVSRLASLRGVDPLRAAAFVALNPLVLVHVVGGAHNDATAMLVAMAGCAAVLALREASGGFAIAAAIGLKLSAAFVAPFALLGARPRPGRFLLGAAVALAAIAAAGYAAFGWHWLDSLGLAGENQGRVSNYSIPNLLSELLNLDIDLVRATAIAAYLGFLAALLFWAWRGADWIRAAAWASLGLLLASAWLLPWYLIWTLPFAALSRDRALQPLVLALTALQLVARVPL
jgi:glycosyl transferase family 87